MNKKRAWLFGHDLRFYDSDGWTRAELEACLDQGSLMRHQMTVVRNNCYQDGSFYRLSHDNGVSSFNVARLSALVSDILSIEGKPLSAERRESALKYNSQVGIFEWGMR